MLVLVNQGLKLSWFYKNKVDICLPSFWRKDGWVDENFIFLHYSAEISFLQIKALEEKIQLSQLKSKELMVH